MTRQYGGRVAVKDYSRTRLLNSSVKLRNAGAARRGRRSRRAGCGKRPLVFVSFAATRKRKKRAGDDSSFIKS